MDETSHHEISQSKSRDIASSLKENFLLLVNLFYEGFNKVMNFVKSQGSSLIASLTMPENWSDHQLGGVLMRWSLHKSLDKVRASGHSIRPIKNSKKLKNDEGLFLTSDVRKNGKSERCFGKYSTSSGCGYSRYYGDVHALCFIWNYIQKIFCPPEEEVQKKKWVDVRKLNYVIIDYGDDDYVDDDDDDEGIRDDDDNTEREIEHLKIGDKRYDDDTDHEDRL